MGLLSRRLAALVKARNHPVTAPEVAKLVGSGGSSGSTAWADIPGKPSTFPPSSHIHADAASGSAGFMSAADKGKLDGLSANLDGYTQMKPAAGLFVSNNANATALGTQAQVANRTVIAPFVAAYGMTIDQLGVSISTLLASSNCKVVIYAADADGRPTTILRETGNIDCSTAGTKFASITPLVLTAGATYWIGVRASGAFTLRTLAVGSLPALSYTNAATPVAQQVLILTETYANAAANWTYASSQHSNALMPLVLMRVA